MIVVEFGSGNTCKNDRQIIRDMIERVVEVDSGQHEVVFKWQLFEDVSPNTPLSRSSFVFAYQFAHGLGYQTTASVFDRESLDFLMKFDVPFIKMACRPKLYYLVRGLNVPIYMSYDGSNGSPVPWCDGSMLMACVPEYPASLEEYERRFTTLWLSTAVSDHTPGLNLWHKYHPDIFEKHVIVERDKSNPDAGPFAVTVDELATIL